MKKIIIAALVVAVAFGGIFAYRHFHQAGGAAGKKIMYRSTMNVGEISDRPGKDSMGMDMVPFTEGEAEAASDGSPEGLATVTISKEKRAAIGLGFEKVQKKIIYREITTPTKIAADETRQFKVMSKSSGWVENLYVNQTGQFVRKGSPLLQIYSPELVSAQQEYLSAINAQGKLAGAAGEGMAESVGALAASSRDRLKLLDMTDAQIQRIRTSGTVERTVTLYAPASGFVTEKTVVKGQRIMENDPLMVLVDLSVVWGEAEIYETDIPYVKAGMPADVSFSYWPGKIFKGKVSFVSPMLDPETRTMKARIELANGALELKPNMFGESRLSYLVGSRVAVTENAVMRTGTMDYVFKEGDADQIVPVEVTLGVRSSDGFYEVASGLSVGDSVASSANFLVDSESSLRAAFKNAAKSK